MPVTKEADLVEGVVGELLEPVLIATVTQDEGRYSIVPRLPIGLRATWSEETGRLFLSGTPTISSSEEHIITGAASRTGVTVLITIRAEAQPAPSVTVAPSVTLQSGRNISPFTIATINNFEGTLLADDFIVAGGLSIGLSLSVSGDNLQLSGYIYPGYKPGTYAVTVSENEIFGARLLGISFTYRLTITAPPATTERPPSGNVYWEGQPTDAVVLALGKRISPSNPILLGYARHSEGREFRVIDNAGQGTPDEPDALSDALPRGVVFRLRASDGALLLQGTPEEVGFFACGLRFTDSSSGRAYVSAYRVTVPPASTESTSNSPPTINVLSSRRFVQVDEELIVSLFSINDADDTPEISYTGLPPGLVYYGSRRLTTGVVGLIDTSLYGLIPSTVRRGDYPITVTANDGVNPPVSANSVIHVLGDESDVFIPPPVHTNIAADFGLQQNVSGSLKRLVTVTGEDSNEVTGLPPDLRWEKRGNNIVLLGRVQAEAPRTSYRVVITSTNLGGQAVSEIVITITGTNEEPEEGTRGITLREQVYTFVQGQVINQQIFDATVDIANSGLPTGLSLTARGLLTGTVTATPASYVVKLTNAAAEVEQAITIIVQAKQVAPVTTLAVFGSGESRYSFSSVDERFTIPITSAQLTGRSVSDSIIPTSWEFAQPEPPAASQATFTVVLNDRPVWLIQDRNGGIHDWLIAPSAVPFSHYNKFVSFALRAVQGERVQQVDVRVFVFGPAPIAPPTHDTASDTILAELALDRRQAPFNLNSGSYQLNVEWEIKAEANAYGIYWTNASITTVNNAGIEVDGSFELDYQQEGDGRYRLNGVHFKGTADYRTARVQRGANEMTFELRADPVLQDMPAGLNLPGVNVRPDQIVELTRENANANLASNRLYFASRPVFNLLKTQVLDEDHLEYEMVQGLTLPDNELAVPPKRPFGTFELKTDARPRTVDPGPPIVTTPARPESDRWIEFEGQPSIEQLGRYPVPLTINRSLQRTYTSRTIDFRPFGDQPDTWVNTTNALFVVRVGSNPAPRPDIENFRINYRIEINEFWEGDPFQAFNESDDPIEITFPDAPEGFGYTEEDGDFRFHWTPREDQAGEHEFDVHITANPGVEGVGVGRDRIRLTIVVVTNRGYISQIENPSSIRDFGEFPLRKPSFSNFQFLEYGLRNSHVVPPISMRMRLPMDTPRDDRWRQTKPGSVHYINIFGMLERPTAFVVDKVRYQLTVPGRPYKLVWLTQQRVEPEGWYHGRGTRVGQSWTEMDTLFTSSRIPEYPDESDVKFIHISPSIREVLLVTVEDDGTAQVIVTGNPIPFFPDKAIRLRIGDYVSAGDAEITSTALTWNTTADVPSFTDEDEIYIEAQPQIVVPSISARLDDEEEIFELGITFNGRLRTNPGVLRGRYLVIRHVDILVAYNESTGELWDAESGVLLGKTITGQSAIQSSRLPGRIRDTLLLRGRDDYHIGL